MAHALHVTQQQLNSAHALQKSRDVISQDKSRVIEELLSDLQSKDETIRTLVSMIQSRQNRPGLFPLQGPHPQATTEVLPSLGGPQDTSTGQRRESSQGPWGQEYANFFSPPGSTGGN